ncbi:hypothetical protein E6R27_08675 [Providencia sp. MGF014]|nr:hypothetical protein E6R27_08675 [Providencia sp. MGF014]
MTSFALTGCVNKPIEKAEPLYCDIASPIYISENDDFTPETARSILHHNLTGYKLCGWNKKRG